MLGEFGLTESAMRAFASLSDEPGEFPSRPKVYVRASPIDGRGIFALCGFVAGELITPVRVGGKMTPAGRYTNHAKDANAEYRMYSRGNLYMIALRDIDACEEITNDYRVNALVEYASATGVPLAQVTTETVRSVMQCAQRRIS